MIPTISVAKGLGKPVELKVARSPEQRRLVTCSVKFFSSQKSALMPSEDVSWTAGASAISSAEVSGTSAMGSIGGVAQEATLKQVAASRRPSRANVEWLAMAFVSPFGGEQGLT